MPVNRLPTRTLPLPLSYLYHNLYHVGNSLVLYIDNVDLGSRLPALSGMVRWNSPSHERCRKQDSNLHVLA
jgi:hypothetical protein